MTLDQVTQAARAAEVAESQVSAIEGDSTSGTSRPVNKLSVKPSKHKSAPASTTHKQKTD